jgi:type VI secretion system protein ImpF
MLSQENAVIKTGVATALLFDRLSDADPTNPDGSAGVSLLSIEELRASVQRELAWLLNTRAAQTFAELSILPRSVINYGIPDFSHLDMRREEDRRLLCLVIKNAVKAYEPRLDKVDVDVEHEQKFDKAVRLVITALICYGSVREPITFDIVVQYKQKSGLIEIREREQLV